MTNSFTLTAESDGNNNITVNSNRYIWVYDAETNKVLGKGLTPTFKVMPPARDLKVYAVCKGADGTEVKSDVKTITVNNFTKIDPIVKLSSEKIMIRPLPGHGMTPMMMVLFGLMVVT